MWSSSYQRFYRLNLCHLPFRHSYQVATRSIVHAINERMATHYALTHNGQIMPDSDRLEAELVWTCELNNQCQEEQLHQPSAHVPRIIYEDQLGFLQPRVRAALDRLDHSDTDAVTTLIMNNPLARSAWCVRRGGKVAVPHTDLNCAGNPCIHHSSLGNHEGMGGKKSALFYIWEKQRLTLLERAWIAENVDNFGLLEFERLRVHYELERIVVEVADQGWKTRRRRQFVVGVLRAVIARISRSECLFGGYTSVGAIVIVIFTRTTHK